MIVNAQRPLRAARIAARQNGTQRRPIQNLVARIRARRAGVGATGAPDAGNYQDILADYPNSNINDYTNY